MFCVEPAAQTFLIKNIIFNTATYFYYNFTKQNNTFSPLRNFIDNYFETFIPKFWNLDLSHTFNPIKAFVNKFIRVTTKRINSHDRLKIIKFVNKNIHFSFQYCIIPPSFENEILTNFTNPDLVNFAGFGIDKIKYFVDGTLKGVAPGLCVEDTQYMYEEEDLTLNSLRKRQENLAQSTSKAQPIILTSEQRRLLGLEAQLSCFSNSTQPDSNYSQSREQINHQFDLHQTSTEQLTNQQFKAIPNQQPTVQPNRFLPFTDKAKSSRSAPPRVLTIEVTAETTKTLYIEKEAKVVYSVIPQNILFNTPSIQHAFEYQIALPGQTIRLVNSCIEYLELLNDSSNCAGSSSFVEDLLQYSSQDWNYQQENRIIRFSNSPIESPITKRRHY